MCVCVSNVKRMAAVIHILLHMQTPFSFVTCPSTVTHTHSTAGWTLQTAWRCSEGVSGSIVSESAEKKQTLIWKEEKKIYVGGEWKYVCFGNQHYGSYFSFLLTRAQLESGRCLTVGGLDVREPCYWFKGQGFKAYHSQAANVSVQLFILEDVCVSVCKKK